MNVYRLLLLIFFVTHAMGEILYVDNTVSNCESYNPSSRDCSSGNFKVYNSIQGAANVVNPGDTVIVKSGIYSVSSGEKYIVKIIRGGSAGAWVTFKSEIKHGAILDGTFGKAYMGFWAGKNIGYVSIENFEIKELRAAGIMFGNNWAGDNWKIKGNNIHHIGLKIKTTQDEMNTFLYGKDGIYLGTNLSNVLIDGNFVHHVGRDACKECWNSETGYPQKHEYHHDHAIYIQYNVSNVTVTNNIFYENHNGYHFKVSPGDSNITLKKNLFYGPNQNLEDRPWIDGGRGGAIVAWHATTGYAGLTNITIEENTFYYPTLDYVIWAYPYKNFHNISNFVIKNNITTDSKYLDPRIISGDWKLSGNTVGANLPKLECFDKLDNDGDGKVDFPEDTKCSSISGSEIIVPLEQTKPKLIKIIVKD